MKKVLAFSFLVVLVASLAECRVLSKSKDKLSLTDWKQKLSEVLDTENEELQILHNLISQENESDESSDLKEMKMGKGKVETTETASKNGDRSKASSSLDFLREEGILRKLEENTARMDGMVIFLSDLKNVLSDAIAGQDKQMRVENEMGELREEMESLRNEISRLKQEQAVLAANNDKHLAHKLHNDETTIKWLTDSQKEIKSQISEISRTCNATAFLQIQHTLSEQNKGHHSDLHVIQKEIEAIKLGQLQQEERIQEVKETIEDVRSVRPRTTVEGQQTPVFPSFVDDEKMTNAVDTEELFLTESLKGTLDTSLPHRRHSKRLKAILRNIKKTTKNLAEDQYLLDKRIEDLEKGKGMTELPREAEKRLYTLEDTMAQYGLNLQNIADKTNVINELHETSTQIFSTLENIETTFDEKFTDMQKNLARIDVSVNSVQNVNEELKEQQIYQSGALQNIKQELGSTKGQLEKNNFRVASLQSQLVKWAAQKCSNEDSESIQNIRISTLESLSDSIKKNIATTRHL